MDKNKLNLLLNKDHMQKCSDLLLEQANMTDNEYLLDEINNHLGTFYKAIDLIDEILNLHFQYERTAGIFPPDFRSNEKWDAIAAICTRIGRKQWDLKQTGLLIDLVNV